MTQEQTLYKWDQSRLRFTMLLEECTKKWISVVNKRHMSPNVEYGFILRVDLIARRCGLIDAPNTITEVPALLRNQYLSNSIHTKFEPFHSNVITLQASHRPQ